MAKRTKRNALVQEEQKEQPVEALTQGRATSGTRAAKQAGNVTESPVQTPKAAPTQTQSAAVTTEPVKPSDVAQGGQMTSVDSPPPMRTQTKPTGTAKMPAMAQEPMAQMGNAKEVTQPKAEQAMQQNPARASDAAAVLSLADAVVSPPAQDDGLAQLMQLAQQSVPKVSSKAEAQSALSDYHYTQSAAVKDAYDALEAYQNRAPEEYNSSYQQQIDGLLDQILNREDFTYDFDADPLYQQYKNQYEHAGRLAMQDTMAQLQGATGGYGSSYAAQAASGAYQSYLNELTGQMPELYQLAYGVYQDKGDGMRDNLAALNAQEKAAYGQYQDGLEDYYKGLSVATDAAEHAYEKDYGQFSDNRDYLEDLMGYYAGQEQQAVDNEQARLNYELAVRKQEEAVRQAEADRAQKQNQWWQEFMAEQQARKDSLNATLASHTSSSKSTSTSTSSKSSGSGTSSEQTGKSSAPALSDKALDLKYTITKEMQNLAAAEHGISQAEINKQAKSIIASYYRTGLITQAEANSLGASYGASF